MAEDNKPKTPEFDEETIKSILKDIESEINVVLKSEKDNLEALSKAHQGEETPSEPQEDTSATESAPKDSGPEAAPPAAAKGDGDADDISPAPSAAPPTNAPTEEPPVEAAPEAGAEQGPVDVEALTGMFCEMPFEDVQAYYLAARTAMVKMQAAQQPAPAPAPAPAAPQPAPAAAPMIEKSEKNVELETLKKKAAEQDEIIAKITQVVEKLAVIPLRKSVASLDEIAGDDNKKSNLKNLNKSQIDEAIKKAISSNKLSKSEKDLIIKFDLGLVKIDALDNILKV